MRRSMSIKSFSNFIAEGKIPTRMGDVRTPKDKWDMPTIVYSVLMKLWEAGEEGLRYTDLVKHILEYHRGTQYNSKYHRGMYASSLVGYKYNRKGNSYPPSLKPNGVLVKFCEKNEKGRWVLKSPEITAYFDSVDRGEEPDMEMIKVFRDLF